jgi:hypothetical protein
MPLTYCEHHNVPQPKGRITQRSSDLLHCLSIFEFVVKRLLSNPKFRHSGADFRWPEADMPVKLSKLSKNGPEHAPPAG